MCSSCNRSPYNTPVNNIVYKQPSLEDNCQYTLNMVLAWKDILFCIRDQGLVEQANLTNPKLNSFMGILLSAINTNSACFFEQELNTIRPYILNIINLNLCQTT